MFASLRRSRKRAVAFLAAGALALTAACDDMPAVGGGPSINTGQPVTVALLIPRSDAGAAGVAQSLENAARLAIADLGPAAQIDLRVYDTAGNAQIAAQVAQKAVDDGAKIILGPLFAEAANAAGVAVADDRVNVLSFSNNTAIAGGNVYLLGSTFANTADRLMSFAASRGKRSMVIVSARTVEGEAARAAVAGAAARNGVSVLSSQGYDFTQSGVVQAVPGIRAAAASADMVMLTSTSAGALPLLAQLLPEAGLDPATTQYVGLSRWDVPPQTLDLPGLEGGWFALPDRSIQSSFEARYASAYGTGPHPLAGLAYDGIAAVGALIQTGQANALTGGALTQNAGFQGVSGIFRFRPDGTNERGLAIATVQNRQVVVIDPAPTSFGRAGF